MLPDQNEYERIQAIQAKAAAYRQSVILLAAVQLDIFAALAGKELAAEEVARGAGTGARATGILLNALAGMGFLEKNDGRFRNSADCEEYCVPGKKYYIGDMLRHDYHLLQRWVGLPEVIKTGEPVPRKKGGRTKEELRDFIMAMENIGRFSVEQVLNVLKIDGAGRMIDIGGGPGAYAISFCRKYPGLEAVVFDLPDVVEIAREQIRKAGMESRIATMAGDYHEDSLGGGYDYALLSNIIHSLGEEDIPRLFLKTASALNRGGLIIVKDFIIDDDMTSPLFSAIFAVNMLIGTERGRCYTKTETERWLADAGFGDIRYYDVTDQTRLVVGKKE